MSEPRELVLDAEGRIGEVMPPRWTGTQVISLRPPGGGREWDVPIGTTTPCDADGNPLPAEAQT